MPQYKAVFLDRDGTIIDDPGYLADPNGVHLLTGASLAIKSLRQAGYKIVVVTNQSGIARGMLTEDTLEHIHAELRRKLAETGAMLDAIFYCPYHPEGTVEKYARESYHRKPSPGMLYQAAEELDLDLEHSWMVGDSSRDIGAGQRANCRTILVRPPEGREPAGTGEQEEFAPDFTARNIVEAAKKILHAAPRPADEPPPPEAAEVANAPSYHEEDELLALLPESADEATPADTLETNRPAESPASLSEQADEVEPRPRLAPPRRAAKPKPASPTTSREDEFNLFRFIACISQVLVFLFLLLTFHRALFQQKTQAALVWALVAAVFQMMTLTLAISNRQK